MKVKCIILITMIISSNIYGQKINLNEIKKIDLHEFNKKKDPIRKAYTYKLDDGTTIRQSEGDETISEDIINPKKPLFTQKRTYYKKNGCIKRESTYFYNFPIGFVRHYFEDGTLKEETDYDKFYPYSYEDMINFIKKEYNVDLYKLEEGHFFNRTAHPYVYYTVRFYNADGFYEQMMFSGINGIMLKRMNDEGKEEVVNDPPLPPTSDNGKGKFWSIFD